MKETRMHDLLVQAAHNLGLPFRLLAGGMGSGHLQLGENPAAPILQGRIIPGTDLSLATLASMRNASVVLLDESGIATPKSFVLRVWDTDERMFEVETEAILRKNLEEEGRWVLKPARRRAGLPVNLNVNEWDSVVSHLEDHAKEASQWVMEAFVDGPTISVLVIDGEIVSAKQHSAFSLIGDGTHTLEELIDRYNAQAGEHAHFRMTAEARQLLREQGAYLGEIVPLGKSIRLSNKPLDPSQTGDTDERTLTEIRELAQKVGKVFVSPLLSMDLISGKDGLVLIGLDLAPDWIDFVDEASAVPTAEKVIKAAMK